ncbi:MAG: phosphopantothenoylcysteine decarboxylase, partial [Planctomycetaceae bacterium]|nr:phosphopantothenoylcysteine decarboxylase [Planctomycetaceae bacterium]
EKFIGPATFEALTNRPVHRHMFQPQEHHQGEHIGLARRGELFIVAPATANTLAKFAHGLADDLLSTLALSFTGPTLLAPAMNTEMWNKPSVQRNIATLQDDGYHIIQPAAGWLSCGQTGAGRMAEPAELLKHINDTLTPKK